MSSFCFVLIIDGLDLPVERRDAPGRAVGIAIGRELLAVRVGGGVTSASCTVFDEDAAGDDPLGVWSYEAATGALVWADEEA